ncbi:MAG: UDP-2,3-diacylglucosamine diphosphatase LpxI [Kiritimatiellae bacterium]|nr:UDP-2,3-diacylglucosamine diphosphatase LpxI [Kiritimatiellia bacterium]MBR2940610.1 UDP-2,3-diacylglucosamine diphosphatase LpxI [Kiritimatiellia bacterium]
MISRLLVVAGGGSYPRLVVEGARRAGVARVDVLSVKGSCVRATRAAADSVVAFAAGECDKAVKWAGEQGYDGVILAGQVSPLSLFRGKFDETVRAWLKAMPVKNAHTIFGKLVGEFERCGAKVLPASAYMDDSLPGVGRLTDRDLTSAEMDDVKRGQEVAADVGRHDVGQTVLVKSGMVLAVEAFEGTNAAIRRAGKLGKGSVLFKAAREGHDWRFDIPVVGLKTLKTMRKAGVTALAFQAGRLILLDREAVIAYANRHGIAIVGIDSGLPPAPVRPE